MNYADFRTIRTQALLGDPVFPHKYSGPLSERERHIVGLTVAATRGCPDCTGTRIKAMKEAGISDDIITSVIDLCAAINSGFVVTMAVQGSRSNNSDPA
jgi:alkylhydroperoxidase/carboxymuconolactone decarboxylase family protein YurZ